MARRRMSSPARRTAGKVCRWNFVRRVFLGLEAEKTKRRGKTSVEVKPILRQTQRPVFVLGSSLQNLVFRSIYSLSLVGTLHYPFVNHPLASVSSRCPWVRNSYRKFVISQKKAQRAAKSLPPETMVCLYFRGEMGISQPSTCQNNHSCGMSTSLGSHHASVCVALGFSKQPAVLNESRDASKKLGTPSQPEICPPQSRAEPTLNLL